MFAAVLTACTFGLSPVLPPVLSSAQEVRALPAGATRSVKLCGVVTFSPRAHSYFYLQDESGGVRVEWPRGDRPLTSGDTVEVTGVTGPGAFLPKVCAARVRPVPGNRSKAPAPLRFNLTSDEAHYLDGQWVSVEAVLQSAWTPDQTWLKVDLGRGRGTVVAYIPRPSAPDVGKVQSLRGAVVSLRGVWEWGPGGPSPPHLLVTSTAELVVVRAAEKPDALPLLTARALAQFRHDPITARLPVRVSGVVTLNYSPRQLFLQDDTGVVQVAYLNRVAPRPGQRVTVVGFPRLGTDPVRLDNAQVRVTDAADGPLPAPHPGTVGDAVSGRLDGRVVAFTGRVLDTDTQGEYLTANVLVDGVTFTAVFLDPGSRVAAGSTIEVAGVATRQQFDKFRLHTFAVIVAGSDYRVLEGPPAPPPVPVWWTPGRITAGALGVCLLGGAGTVLMRLQVRRAAALALRERVERGKLEEQLKLAARLEAAGRLAGSVAHDFNNMLTVINGCTALLEAEIGEGNHPDRTLKFAGAIRRAGEQAATLTRQLLAFSRQQAVAPYPLDLNDVLAGAADMLERLLGDRIAVRLHPERGVPLAVAEPGLLLQVLLNLAVNAADAMPQGGTFALATSASEPGWVRLTATDTGTGMPAEVKARAFESGFTTKAAGKGTGLGLSTVSGIVRGLGGRIGVVSEPGRGTAFEIDLPAAPPGPALPASSTATVSPTVASPASPTVEMSLDGTRPAAALVPAVVLLVEDEEAVCALLRHILDAAGHTVLAACDPAAALALLDRRAGALDLLVTDVMLPGLSGRQLADRVRALHPAVKVLFMSGYNVEEIREQGVSEEQVEFLHKPFLPRELVARVAQLLVPSHP